MARWRGFGGQMSGPWRGDGVVMVARLGQVDPRPKSNKRGQHGYSKFTP